MVPRALISTLLIAGIFSTPFFTSYSFAEEVATSTAETLVEVVPKVVAEPEATSTAETSAPQQGEVSTTDPVADGSTENSDNTIESTATLTSTTVTEDEEEELELIWGCVEGNDGDGNPVETCGLGYYRELCGYSAGVEECQTFFEIVEEDEVDAFTLAQEDLFQNEYLSLSTSVNGQTLVDNGTISFPTGTSGTLQWSYADHAPVPFVLPPPFEWDPISFPDALAASTLTFQIYKGEVGEATLVHSETIPQGTLPDISFTSLGEGHYIFVLSSTFPKDTYPPGHDPMKLCGELCPLYQTRIDAFTFFMEHGQALYDDVEDEIDAQAIFMEDEQPTGHLLRYRPMAFGMVEVTVGAETLPSGVSNVLFLPGIKGSRLYSDENRCGVIGCDNKLWDPASSVDVQDLYLTPDGKSSRSDIYAKEGDIVDEISILGTPLKKKFYASFIDDMNELQASTTCNGGDFEWKAAAYDWRLSLDDIINNGVERDGKIYYEEASSTPYIEQTLRELAATSTTGKVTIIAHSNGGLVTKALLAKLGDAETARLIDKIIFVGVPQTGAPQALGGLLFGDREGLPLDLLPAIATPAVARGLAEYSPMAYHLMPSNRYLSDTQDPSHSIIGFSGSVLYGNERSAYGSSIDTITELDNFLLAQDGGRVKPEASDVKSANVLNSNLIAYANTTHDSLDSWVPPASVTLYQVAGWGANTISGIDFYDEKKILGINTGYKRQYRPIFVEDGDGVVPIPSALMMSAAPNVFNYWINLRATGEQLRIEYDHGDLFEMASTRQFIEDKLQYVDRLPQFISLTQPHETSQRKKLIFQLHSPLTLGLHDPNGNYTGLNEDGSVSEEVAGVEYGEFGDVKYLIAPAGTEYELIMQGQEAGVFSLDIQEQTGNTVTSSATIADVPTTANTIARLTTTSGTSDTSSLQVDYDGNGTNDTTITVEASTTVNYVPAIPAADDSTRSSSSHNSSSIVGARNLLTPVTSLPVVLSPAKTEQTAATQQKGIVAGAFTEPTPVVSKTATAEILPRLSQTASVFYAFSSVAHWLQMSLYNMWQGLITFFHIF